MLLHNQPLNCNSNFEIVNFLAGIPLCSAQHWSASESRQTVGPWTFKEDARFGRFRSQAATDVEQILLSKDSKDCLELTLGLAVLLMINWSSRQDQAVSGFPNVQ